MDFARESQTIKLPPMGKSKELENGRLRQSHDLKHIGSQNPKRLTKVVLSIQHEAVRPSVGLICTT